MYISRSLLLIPVIFITAAASNQLTFSKDTVEFNDPHFSSNYMNIRNNTDSVVHFDTILYTWHIDGKKQVEAIGMEFDGCMYFAPDAIRRSDTSFYFLETGWPRSLEIKARELLNISRLSFGHCVGCSGVLNRQRALTGSGRVSIRTVFINNKAGRDTVVFVGLTSYLISSDVIRNDASHFRSSPEHLRTHGKYLLSGRKTGISGKIHDRAQNPSNVYIVKAGKVSIILK